MTVHRYTYSWVEPIISLCERVQRVEAQDLPVLPAPAKATFLRTKLDDSALSQKESLLLSLYHSHKALFHQQWICTAVQSVSAFAPQVCIYNVLRLLERDEGGSSTRGLVWIWVITLGAIIAFLQTLETRQVRYTFQKATC